MPRQHSPGRVVPLRPPLAPLSRRPARGGEGADVPAELTHPSRRDLDPAGSGGAASASSSPSQPARFRTLVLPHLDSAYGFARYLCRDPAAAEDIAQEAMLKAYRAWDGYRGGEPKAWLLSIVRNAYFDWARARQTWDARTVNDPDLAEAVPDDPETGAEATLIRRGDVDALRAAIEALPEPFREALVLKDLEELSYKEIAEATGAPIGTVMSRLARARQMLAKAMGMAQEAVR